ncbi:glycosyltransferase involved in cell wall biosynthesis [Microbacterium halimionae]|uniref:Glycosyltransferase involved in cell wall biosynthesis n=1 Tax=Microbacterium halimionae TaxID=1526413 RepID=A0A7W3JLB5_9MICO|nr:glycosyltransferase [Microbacterium halimionae]MBA8815001.1 glycosyltransferase involved in cell wall biosynthesis [Microbacterium halimionae]NII94208.1 glycosyltransferase involved in cell wall biosynthesis [Microbacterium halimionae]
MPEMTLAVVTALSPSTTTLAEYGLHLLSALGRKDGVRVVALVEDLDVDYPEIEGVEVRRAWRFNSRATPVRIVRELRDVGADVVLFNAHFTSFGSSKVSAALGLMTPWLSRLSGTRAITLLHNIVETVDLGVAGFGASSFVERILRGIGTAVTWCVLRSNVVATTMPRYVEILRKKYGASHAVLAPHGAFDVPDVPRPPTNPGAVMSFGKFGTYKKIESLIDAARSLERPDVKVVIAGGDSPNTPGYLADVEARMGGQDVDFVGYVAEEDVEDLFRDAQVAVFPYTATTGSSGVLHQAGAFGCAPILPRIGDLEDLIQEEGFTGVFFDPNDTDDLARAIAFLLDNEEERARIAEHNYRAACGLTLDDVADWYLIHAGLILDGDARTYLSVAKRKRAKSWLSTS